MALTHEMSLVEYVSDVIEDGEVKRAPVHK